MQCSVVWVLALITQDYIYSLLMPHIARFWQHSLQTAIVHNANTVQLVLIISFLNLWLHCVRRTAALKGVVRAVALAAALVCYLEHLQGGGTTAAAVTVCSTGDIIPTSTTTTVTALQPGALAQRSGGHFSLQVGMVDYIVQT